MIEPLVGVIRLIIKFPPAIVNPPALRLNRNGTGEFVEIPFVTRAPDESAT